jgi:predicted secreted protein
MIRSAGQAEMVTAPDRLPAQRSGIGEDIMSVLHVSEADHTRTLIASVGDQIELTLRENATTGYVWQIVQRDDGLEPSGDEFRMAGSPGLMGAGGEHVFRFRVVRNGAAQLTMRCVRPWDPASDETARFVLDVMAGH